MQKQVQDELEMEEVTPMSGRSAAGRKGGLATKARMDPDFFKRIGHLGGKSRGGK
jgi:general stress protein YciG